MSTFRLALGFLGATVGVALMSPPIVGGMVAVGFFLFATGGLLFAVTILDLFEMARDEVSS